MTMSVKVVIVMVTERKPCNLRICPKWSAWTVTECSAGSCNAPGVQRRTRVCAASADMSPKTTQVFALECYSVVDKCRGHCRPVFAPWAPWSACSAACGLGTSRRRRRCMQRGKVVAGRTCERSLNNGERAEQSKKCNRGMCTSWGEWTPMGRCSTDCNGEMKVRRICKGKGNVRPMRSSPGDMSCSQKTQSCGSDRCSIFFTDWNNWSPCSTRCGEGYRRRYRYCLSEKEGQKTSEPFRKCAKFGKPIDREVCLDENC